MGVLLCPCCICYRFVHFKRKWAGASDSGIACVLSGNWWLRYTRWMEEKGDIWALRYSWSVQPLVMYDRVHMESQIPHELLHLRSQYSEGVIFKWWTATNPTLIPTLEDDPHDDKHQHICNWNTMEKRFQLFCYVPIRLIKPNFGQKVKIHRTTVRASSGSTNNQKNPTKSTCCLREGEVDSKERFHVYQTNVRYG